MLRAVPKRAAHRKDVSLHRLRLDHAVGPYGFEQLIVRDQASSIFDQIRQNEKRLRAQQDALLRPGVATSPETLVQGIEPEGNKHFHRRSGSQTSDSARDGVQCIAPIFEFWLKCQPPPPICEILKLFGYHPF